MFRVISCVVSGRHRPVREENVRGGLLTLSRLQRERARKRAGCIAAMSGDTFRRCSINASLRVSA